MSTDYQHVGGYGPESLPGHSGSDTSEEAARHPGVGKKTKLAHEQLKATGYYGLTAAQLCGYFGWGHGAASGALSRLHRAGLIARLTERRGRQLVYVDPEFLYGRETSEYTPNAANREDRKPMPLERQEPTLEKVTRDLMTVVPKGKYLPAVLAETYAESLAPCILEIVKKYR